MVGIASEPLNVPTRRARHFGCRRITPNGTSNLRLLLTCHMMKSSICAPVLVMGQAPGSHVPAEAVIAEADSSRGEKTLHIGLTTHG